MDLSRQWVQVVLRVEVKVDPVVTQCFHVRLAARDDVALGIRGTHIGRVFANDVGDCTLVLSHLLFTLVGGDV